MNFVIYGEDKLLMEQRLKTLKKKYHIQEDDMNIVTYWCQDTPLSSIIEDALTPPFLSEYKMIVVKNPVFLTTQKQKIASDEDIQKFMDYLKLDNPTTVLVIYHDQRNFDERKKVVKELRKNAHFYDIEKMDEHQLYKATHQAIKSRGCEIDEEALRLFLSRMPNNLLEISQEVQKLCLYTKHITTQTVDLLVSKQIEENVFELTQANDAQISALNSQADLVETHQIVFLIDKCSDYIKELKLTNNPRLWLEVAIIDLANLTENTSLVELQNRIARLEGGATNIGSNARSYSAPVQVASYKTAPTPVMKPEMQRAEHAKPDILKQKEAEKQVEIPKEQPVLKSNEENQVPVKAQAQSADDFAPMPKSKAVAGDDISALWGQLLENIHSAPTRALLKQWANPVKITADDTVLSMKNEIFLNQVQSGSKKQAIIDAVNSLFGQSNSNVTIRLPHPDDVQVKPSAPHHSAPKTFEAPKPKPSPIMKPVSSEPGTAQN